MTEEKINQEVESSKGEVKEEEVELTEEDIKKVGNAIKQAHLDATKLSPKNQELFNRMLEEAKMPVRLEDKDFVLGEQELDVRHLSRANWRQMEFREQILSNIYLKQIVMGQNDILRMLMVIADKLGVKDIVEATDIIIEKITKAEEEKAKKLN